MSNTVSSLLSGSQDRKGIDIVIDAIHNLLEDERILFKEIVHNIVRNNIKRIEVRLRDIPRVF